MNKEPVEHPSQLGIDEALGAAIWLFSYLALLFGFCFLVFQLLDYLGSLL